MPGARSGVLRPYLIALLATAGVLPAEAQVRSGPAGTRVQIGLDSHRLPAPAQGPRSGFSALAIETLGGAVGSAAGFGLGVLAADTDACNNEDLQCILEDVAIALGASAVGAALGSWTAGKAGSTRPSLLGAALGSVAGAVAGLGTVHLLTEEFDLAVNDGIQLLSYVITQGVVTALGSRLIAAISD